MECLTVRTDARSAFVEITGKVAGLVRESGVRDGIAVVFTPHTTAGITINENADPTVKGDITRKLERLIERDDPDFSHLEGNSDSHLKSSLTGASETLIIEDGSIVLGTWQGIFLVEFDGPRTRKFFVKVIG